MYSYHRDPNYPADALIEATRVAKYRAKTTGIAMVIREDIPRGKLYVFKRVKQSGAAYANLPILAVIKPPTKRDTYDTWSHARAVATARREIARAKLQSTRYGVFTCEGKFTVKVVTPQNCEEQLYVEPGATERWIETHRTRQAELTG